MLLIAIPTFLAYITIVYFWTGWNSARFTGEILTLVSISTVVMAAIVSPTLIYGLKPKWDDYKRKAEQESQPETIVTVEPLSNLQGSKPAASSQFLGMGWSRNGNSNELHIEFGVIRITALKGNLTRCRAQLKTQFEVSVSDAKTQEVRMDKIWLDGGNLNWYSQSLRENIAQNDTIDYFTLNKHFINCEADIRQGDYADLLFCYLVVPPFRSGQTTFASSDVVFLCNDKHASSVGMIPNDRPFEFEAKITLVAPEHKSTHKFHVSMSKSSIVIYKVLED